KIFLNSASSFEAGRPRHSNIHEHDIRAKFPDFFYRFGGVTSLAHYFEINFALQYTPQPFTEKCVVIDDQTSNTHCLPRNSVAISNFQPPEATTRAFLLSSFEAATSHFNEVVRLLEAVLLAVGSVTMTRVPAPCVYVCVLSLPTPWRVLSYLL